MSSPDQLKAEIKSWILKKNSKVAADQLNDDTPILEQRIISSLHVLDLILYLEKLSAKKINMSHLKPGVFQSVNTIYQNFFEAGA